MTLAELAILVVAETECQRARWSGLKPDATDSRLCYSPGFDLRVLASLSPQPFGSFPKISTTVENTVENIVGPMS